MIETVASKLMGSDKSFCFPLITIATAALLKDFEILLAISIPVIPFYNFERYHPEK